MFLVPLWQYFANILGPSGYIIFIIIITYISNLIAGFSFAWSSPILVKLNGTVDNPLGNPITLDESDLIGSLFYVGAAIGPLFFIASLEMLGRKPAIIIMSLPLPICYFLLAISKDIEIYYVSRIFLGFAVGSICGTTPIYASEILPPNNRGSLMSLSNSFIQGGFLISYIIGSYLPITLFNLIISVLSFIFICLFTICCPETPYYVMRSKGKIKCKEILVALRKNNSNDELNDIEQIIKEEIDNKSYLKIFSSKKNIKAFFIATIILLIQQLVGITIIIGYSQLIFLETNIEISSEKCSIIVGSLQVISSFITPLISEKYNRKSMLCFSLSGLTICNFLIFFYFNTLKTFENIHWIPLVTLVFFVIFDNCGNGPLPWVLLGEIYPTEIKSIGPALSTSIYYFTQFLLTFLFNKIELKFMFFGFGFCCILGILYVKYFVTETKGKTLREIEKSLEDITA